MTAEGIYKVRILFPLSNTETRRNAFIPEALIVIPLACWLFHESSKLHQFFTVLHQHSSTLARMPSTDQRGKCGFGQEAKADAMKGDY